VKSNLKGDIASSLLAPSLRARFSDLLGVAARKSVFAWQESALPEAQVVVLDPTSNINVLTMLPPCVIWVGREQPVAARHGGWVSRLSQDFTVSDLIDTLDRAAVFLLDWKARQRAALTARSAAQSQMPASDFSHSSVASAPSTGTVAAAQTYRYRVSAWVVLPEPFNGPECVSALALLSRQPVTMQQLQIHTGLAPVLVVDLLQELNRRKVLLVSAPAPATAQSTTSRGNAPVRQGFLTRLSRWIQGAQQ
jgi:hypothetical protein